MFQFQSEFYWKFKQIWTIFHILWYDYWLGGRSIDLND